MALNAIQAKSPVAAKAVRPVQAREEKPVASAANADQLQLSGASSVFDLPGLAAGQTLKVDKGSSFKGHGFGGKATVTAFDGKTLDLMVNAKAMIFIHVNVHLRFEKQPDGSVRFVGERVKGGDDKSDQLGAGTPSQVGTALQTVSQEPGKTVFKASNGQLVTVTSVGKGGVQVAYDKYQMVLKP
jgi:hypothetical protein